MARGESFVREGARRLQELVGSGHLKGSVYVDQVYAKYQHERLDLKHPRGGGAKYLEGPLLANYQDYLQRLAGSVLQGTLERTMADCMQALAGAMSRATPVEFNNLRRSAEVRVYSNGARVYTRAPEQRRLSAQQLKLLRRGWGRRR
jgi:hypothetical protein